MGQDRAENVLEKLLLSIDRPGDFCAHGRLLAPMPWLEVEGAGALSFPVPEAQVRALIEVAERAPYGKGSETLLDRSVRDCWQIDPGRVRLAGAAWPETFAKILDSAAAGLGCPADRLDAQLYKLLIYEPGGFFSAHRDTEKADGMIATLSISLPTAGAAWDDAQRDAVRAALLALPAALPPEPETDALRSGSRTAARGGGGVRARLSSEPRTPARAVLRAAPPSRRCSPPSPAGARCRRRTPASAAQGSTTTRPSK